MKRDQRERLRAEDSGVLKTKVRLQLGLFSVAVVPLFQATWHARQPIRGDVDQRGPGLDGVAVAGTMSSSRAGLPDGRGIMRFHIYQTGLCLLGPGRIEA
jgi:hypothetical protein